MVWKSYSTGDRPVPNQECIVVIHDVGVRYEHGYYDEVLKSWKLKSFDGKGEFQFVDIVGETKVIAWGFPNGMNFGNNKSPIKYECITPPRLIPEAADLYTQVLLTLKQGDDATDLINHIVDNFISEHNYGAHPDVLYLHGLNDFMQHKGCPERDVSDCLSANPDHPLALA
ncbi:MAG: hypothetical protein HUJ98_13060, partial [Bacteroidaceae bacterium]|nr:hypothetical protein [Bacteroidaceae bacterium]